MSSIRHKTVDNLMQNLRLYCSMILYSILPEHMYSILSIRLLTTDQRTCKTVYFGLLGQSALAQRAKLTPVTSTLFLNWVMPPEVNVARIVRVSSRSQSNVSHFYAILKQPYKSSKASSFPDKISRFYSLGQSMYKHLTA